MFAARVDCGSSSHFPVSFGMDAISISRRFLSRYFLQSLRTSRSRFIPSQVLPSRILFLFGLMWLATGLNELSARQAVSYLPSEAPVLSVYDQTVTDAETDSVSKAEDATLELSSFGPVESGAVQYNYVRNDGLGEAGTPFPLYAHGDTVYASAGELFDFSIIDSLGIEIGFDETTRVDLVRLDAVANSDWVILNETFTVPLPDSILAFLPDGIDFQDEMEIGIEAFNTRLPDQIVSTPLGEMNAVVFKPSLNVSVTLFVNTFIGPIPIELSVLENYGVEFYFAASMGIVRELLLPEIVNVSNSTLGIDIELAAIPGRELVIREFGDGGGSGGGDDLVVQEFRAGWNMVSLPVGSEDSSAEAHFPNAVSNTLYEFDGSYVLATEMAAGAGYWLNLSSAGPVTFEGSVLPAMTVPLFAGWNLVGALGSETLVEDPDDLIVTGGIFGFDGGYLQAEQLSPGMGYWVASSGDGAITLSAAEAVSGSVSVGGTSSATGVGTGAGARFSGSKDTGASAASLPDKLMQQGYDQLQFSDHRGRELHPLLIARMASANAGSANVTASPLQGDLQASQASQATQASQASQATQVAHSLQYTLPPVPPEGASDVRFGSNRWVSNTEYPLIRIRQAQPGMSLKLRAKDGSQTTYRIRFYADTDQNILIREDLLGLELPLSVPEQAVLAQVAPDESNTHSGLQDGPLSAGQPELLGNYPNPFNPSTTISYRLPADTQVTLEIFNLLGKRVRTLVDTRQQAGTYQVVFDAGSLASGIYLYRLTTGAAATGTRASGATSVSRRMILVK